MSWVWGGNDQLTINSALITATPLSFSAWMYATNSSSNDYCVMSASDASATDEYFRVSYQMISSSSAQVRTIAGSNAGGFNAASTSTGEGGTGAWNHAGCSWTSPTLRYAIHNGNTATDQMNTGDSTPLNIDRFTIGRETDQTASDSWNGRLGECALWNAVLSINEWVALSKGANPLSIRRANIVGYWPIHQSQAEPGTDYSGNRNHLTNTGITVGADHPPVIPYSARYWGSAPLIEVAAPGGLSIPVAMNQYRRQHLNPW